MLKARCSDSEKSSPQLIQSKPNHPKQHGVTQTHLQIDPNLVDVLGDTYWP